jgi:hypothetical protein
MISNCMRICTEPGKLRTQLSGQEWASQPEHLWLGAKSKPLYHTSHTKSLHRTMPQGRNLAWHATGVRISPLFTIINPECRGHFLNYGTEGKARKWNACTIWKRAYQSLWCNRLLRFWNLLQCLITPYIFQLRLWANENHWSRTGANVMYIGN